MLHAVRRWLRPYRAMARQVAETDELPRRVRARVLATIPWLLTGRPLRRDLELILDGGPVYLGRRTTLIDAITVAYVWEGAMFPADCDGRVVLDLGAHKGYFGAWALAHGAAGVLSVEPQSENFALLERSRRANARGAAWRSARAAVGSEPGRVRLYISPESWAHSIYAEMVEATSVEEVTMTTLPDLLDQACEQWPDRDIVLKLNVEGAAGQVVLPVDPQVLAPVVEILLDHEPGSPYELQTLLDHVARAGLDDVEFHDDQVIRIRRSDVAATAGR